MKYSLLTLALVVVAGVVYAAVEQNKVHSWRYKMTVTVETPEGEISGSAVRQMGNDLFGSPLSQQGNPADVRGEAVVVDMGKRGALFALISDRSDFEFYDTFPEPNGRGGATPEAIRYFASLPVGTKGTLEPGTPAGYPMLVAFTDMNDPKSVTKAQEWERVYKQPYGQQWRLKADHMEELFGEGVRLKNITLEITDEPVTWGVVDRYLPWLDEYFDKLFDGRRISTIEAENRLANFLGAGSFKTRRSQ